MFKSENGVLKVFKGSHLVMLVNIKIEFMH